MALKLKGYCPTDTDLAYKRGVTKTYHLPEGYGPDGRAAFFKVTFLYAGVHNVEFQAKRSALLEQSGDLSKHEQDLAITALIYDNIILDWATDILLEDGSTLEPTRENFLESGKGRHGRRCLDDG